MSLSFCYHTLCPKWKCCLFGCWWDFFFFCLNNNLICVSSEACNFAYFMCIKKSFDLSEQSRVPLCGSLNHLAALWWEIKQGKESFVLWVNWGHIWPVLQDDVSGFSQTDDCSLTECGSLQLSLQRGNKSCLYPKKTNNLAVLKLSIGKVGWNRQTVD